jgi:NAD(P)-dependent dehydrogenase (short-subunit alcohol dehydrogenase family)
MLFHLPVQKLEFGNDEISCRRMGKHGIRFNAIAPTFPTKGSMGDASGRSARKIRYEEKVPLRRVGEHQDWLIWPLIWFQIILLI